jgi:signal peptidase I
MTEKKTNNSIKQFIKDILFVAVFYILFTTFAWGSFHIPSGSMEPTLEVGDRIFVSKFAYGYNQYSFYFDPPILKERILSSNPQRGDVAVFTLDRRGESTDFIKRVIGLPGDKIMMRNGRLFINDKLIERNLIRKVTYTSYLGGERRVNEYEETLPNGVKHRIYEETDQGRYDNTRLFVVPENHYFMMGDNRDGSNDSRGTLGFIDLNNFVGEANITTFSLYDCDQGKEIGCLGPIPYGRFFNSID